MFCATVFDCINRSIISDELEEESISPESLKEQKENITGSKVISKVVEKPSTKNPVIDFVINCSFYTNSEKLFRTDNGGKFSCLNGLRAISMVWIIVAHSFRYLADYAYFFVFSKFFY